MGNVGHVVKRRKPQSKPVSGAVSERILRDIEHHILSGIWAPGHRIPFEHELMIEYDCSRMTVHKVISALSTRGLVTRRRRAGTFVSAPQIEQSLLELRDFETQARLAGLLYRYELIERKIAPANELEAKSLDLPVGHKAIKIRALHRINELPVALEQRVINPHAIPSALEESFEDVAPGTWLLKMVPWTEAEHLIGAMPADKATAKLLQVAEGSACLVLDRHTWRSGMPVTEVRLIHPGDRYHFIGRFQPMAAGAVNRNGKERKTKGGITRALHLMR
ncbi:histidine utilization repressor [Nordella sp. HKS 07]|nr:histidine utilization repressor [Nordella sp. HKS 07]